VNIDKKNLKFNLNSFHHHNHCSKFRRNTFSLNDIDCRPGRINSKQNNHMVDQFQTLWVSVSII